MRWNSDRRPCRSGCVVRAVVPRRLGQGFAPGHDEIAVHEEKPLQRNVGVDALLAGADGIGEIEERQEGIEFAAADEAVDGAAVIIVTEVHGAGRRLGRSRLPETKSSESRRGFGIEAVAVEAPEQAIFGVRFEVRFGEFAALSCVDGREHDFAMQFLDGPAFADEAGGEIVEQFGMRRAGRLAAEVAGGADDAWPK